MTRTRSPTRGLVLGKFLPPHHGHLHLIDFARSSASTRARCSRRAGRPPLTTRRGAPGRRATLDAPWVADPVRYLPDDRGAFLARCEDALRDAGRSFVLVRGETHEERTRAIREHLGV